MKETPLSNLCWPWGQCTLFAVCSRPLCDCRHSGLTLHWVPCWPVNQVMESLCIIQVGQWIRCHCECSALYPYMPTHDLTPCTQVKHTCMRWRGCDYISIIAAGRKTCNSCGYFPALSLNWQIMWFCVGLNSGAIGELISKPFRSNAKPSGKKVFLCVSFSVLGKLL